MMTEWQRQPDMQKKLGCCVNKNYSLPTGEKTGWWWLRSPGRDSDLAARVFDRGDISQHGSGVNFFSGCVRPAFWLNL